MSFSLIAALAKHRVIGKDNKLPWHIPEDLANFYQLVRGKVVIMGRKTYESMGKPIKDATNIVLSHNRSLHLPGCTVVHSLAEVLALYQDFPQEVMVIGGASVYAQFLPLANKMYLTFIEHEVPGDTYFPQWQQEEWQLVVKQEARSARYSYSFMVFHRK